MRLGIIGTGRIGRMHVENALALGGDHLGSGHLGGSSVEVVVADAYRPSAEAAGRDFGVTVAADVDDLLARGIDGVVIAGPTGAHAELILSSLRAGLPVFCEKPLTPTSAQSMELLEDIERMSGVVQIGHQRRFDAGYLAAKAAFDAGELGWIHSLDAVTADQLPPSIDFIKTSGGLFRDCSVHDFDIIAWLTGRRIVEVFARGSNNGDPAIKEAGDVDTAIALMTLADGTLATATATRFNGAGHDTRLEVRGSKQTLAVGLDDSAALKSAEPGATFPTGAPPTVFQQRFAAAYRAELVAFCRLIRGEIENPCTPAESIVASRVADAAQESLETGRPVRI
ncbi:Gfo/Idh/MocA family protein [Spelaeicoccus albus]|uniref:Myo-inositol 2-dehydrogenase/D-chiro-inositol 1-dehydrogenase n=1 Tax=Spelaeicoccus albus TaxID=1280376 RepID=A0A7Z0AC42_9MICO|nr:Gfo/Idh/MocA family oxidoreductase [Spelaeicoccus albus]NYI67160.1 myo-inositol 2-dehydrogenase/D-chiro-inositol 1-dehydrogenase [Spelaeicoccus albus]